VDRPRQNQEGAAEMGVIREHQAFHDFRAAKFQSTPGADKLITHAVSLSFATFFG